MAKAQALTIKVDPALIRRLKIYVAVEGKTIKAEAERWLASLPSYPSREREATA